MAAGGSTTVVLFALGANFGIACAKFAAAAWTGSSAMLSEAIHSLVDTSNQGLLLYGIKRSAKPADALHPFGYSRELYFWSFVVAVLLFSLGAGVALYEGVEKLLHPHPITDPHINYIVLGIAIALEGLSTFKALEEFNKRRGRTAAITALRSSKDPALFTVVLEDLAALTGLMIALAGVMAAHLLGIEQADGIASIAIGIILAMVAAFMCIEIKPLLVGEAADADVQAGLYGIFAARTGDKLPLKRVNEVRTMHLGAEDILLAASVELNPGQSAEQVMAATAEIEETIQNTYPAVRRVFIEVQSEGDYQRLEVAHNGTAPHKPKIVTTGLEKNAAPAAAAALAKLAQTAGASSQPQGQNRKARKKGRKR